MITEQPDQLWFNKEDVKAAVSAGFWSGVLTTGTIFLIGVGFIVMVFKA